MAGYRVRVDGVKEARALIHDLSDRELQNRTRRGLRAGAKVFRTAYRAEVSGKAGIPHTFAKTKTRAHRNPLGVSTGPVSPLVNIFEEGAGGHTIAPTGPLLLSGAAGVRWRGRAFLASQPVHHPGMGARPTVGPVFDRENGHASDEAMDTILRGIR